MKSLLLANHLVAPLFLYFWFYSQDSQHASQKILVILCLQILHNVQLALHQFQLSHYFTNNFYHNLSFCRLFCPFYQDKTHYRGSFLFYFGQLVIDYVKNCLHYLPWLQPSILHFWMKCLQFITQNGSFTDIPKLLQRLNLIFKKTRSLFHFASKKDYESSSTAPTRLVNSSSRAFYHYVLEFSMLQHVFA